MGDGLSKTLVFLLFIGIGLALKGKIKSKEQLVSIKTVILSLALPATIFIALLKINIELKLIVLPIVALLINLTLFGSSFLLLKLLGIKKSQPKGRTILLLTASMAPGLSCFPFIMEYLGEEPLAYAAFADVGNKFYGLILLYLIAMHWFYQNLLLKQLGEKKEGVSRLKELVLSLIKEPINIVLVVGLGLLLLGFDLASLPTVVQTVMERLSLLMTPLVLIFIGLAVNVGRKSFGVILQILLWKSGVAFLISGVILCFLPSTVALATSILVVAFPQSACSFWPFAHMTAVKSLEKGRKIKTFSLKFALNILAFSLPFSTMMILTICSSGALFSNTWLVFVLGIIFIAIPLCIQVVTSIKKTKPIQMKREKLQLSE